MSSSPVTVRHSLTGAMYPCVCCGYRTLSEPPGSYEICAVCGWEDDAVQLRYPEYVGGANGTCLVDAQATVRERPLPMDETDTLDSGWRMVDGRRDDYERVTAGTPWPEDLTQLYWWRPTYWRRQPPKV